MRTRKEIEEEVERMANMAKLPEEYKLIDMARTKVILEVVLDIRDLLIKRGD